MINKTRAKRPIEFIQRLKLVGDFTGMQFVLQKWQKDIITNVYGTVKANGLRKYRYLYLEVPKKNGKTPLVAALGLYHVTCDPAGGEIYCCAAERDQASQTYEYMKSMIAQDDCLGDLLRVVDSKKEIHNDTTGTYVKVLSSEAYSKHGKAPSVVIMDELHAFQKRDLWDIMTFGTGSARKEPLYLVITTAGDDPDKKSIGWEVHDYASKVRDGEIIDPEWYVKIYNAPEDSDIYDEKVWYDANPSLGVAIDIDAVRSEAIKAKNSSAVEKNFRWLRLNQWVSLKRLGWLPVTLWDDTEGQWTRESLYGKYCYEGIDLSTRTDLTAFVYLFPPQNGLSEWRFFFDAFTPAENMRHRLEVDHVNYEQWSKDGHIIATPGNVVDYKKIADRVRTMERLYKIKYHCGDPWHLEIIKQHLSEDVQGKFIEIPQTMSGMSTAMGELERMFLGTDKENNKPKEISHEHNPCGRWAFGNVVVATDGNANQKPMKDRSIERIDPIVALINAMAGAIKLEPKRSVYEAHGIRIVG